MASYEIRVFEKNDFLLKKGEVCEGVYLVLKGCCRQFTITNEKEYTTNFSIENQIVTVPESYFLQLPSFEYIQAIEDVEARFINFKYINLLKEKYPEFADFVGMIYEANYLDAIKLLNEFRTLSAFQRYEKFLKESPFMLQRIPLGYLASYLGMSRETLSRMRGLVC